MQEWVLVLVYAIVLVSYAAIHQIIFRYRFKELAFTLLFLVAVFFLLMLVTQFHSTMTWFMIVTLIVTVLYSVYVTLMVRFLREKIQKQVLGGMNIEDMLKNIFRGDLSSPEQNEKDRPDIKVEEVDEEEKNQDDENYEVGDIIIDEQDDKDKQDDKKD